MSVTCPVPACSTAVEWPLPLCQRHWYRVPSEIRKALWEAHRRGGAGTPDYETACQEAIASVQPARAALEGPTCD